MTDSGLSWRDRLAVLMIVGAGFGLLWILAGV
jgi:hypothetical protein